MDHIEDDSEHEPGPQESLGPPDTGVEKVIAPDVQVHPRAPPRRSPKVVLGRMRASMSVLVERDHGIKNADM